MSDPSHPGNFQPMVSEEQFSEFEQDFLAAIGSRFDPNDGDDLNRAEDLLDDTPASSAAPGAEATVEGQESDAPETDPQLEPEPTDPGEVIPDPESDDSQGEEAPPEGEAAEDSGLPSSNFTFGGVSYTPDQLQRAIGVNDFFSKLSPDQVQGIDALLSGQYRLTPANQPIPPPAPVEPVSLGATSPSSPTLDEGEWLDPRAAQEIQRLRGELQQVQQTVEQTLTPVLQSQHQREYQARLDAITEASTDFQSKYHLTDESMRSLEASIVEGGILPGLQQRAGGVKQGMNAALEMMFWTTPTYRDPYVKTQETATAAEQAAQEAATVRKERMSALSGSGGSAPRRDPVPSSAEDRQAAMEAEIRQHMNGSTV